MEGEEVMRKTVWAIAAASIVLATEASAGAPMMYPYMDVDADAGAVANANANASSYSKQFQGQGQKQQQQQGNQQATTVNIGGDENPHQAPALILPGLVAAPETCMGSTSVGGTTWFGGLSFGTTWKQDDCNRRMYARMLLAIGHKEAAVSLLANNPEVAAALRKAKVPIPGESASSQGAGSPLASSSTPSTDESFGRSFGAGRVAQSNCTGWLITAANGQIFCQPRN